MEHFSQDPSDPLLEEGAANRQESRDSLFLMANVRIVGREGMRKVRVRNLSTGGLMAELPEGLAQGVRVEIGVRGLGWLSGQVAWYAAGRIGIAFDLPVDPMLARKPVGKGSRKPTVIKPILPRGGPR